jgi:hypothetical protein
MQPATASSTRGRSSSITYDGWGIKAMTLSALVEGVSGLVGNLVDEWLFLPMLALAATGGCAALSQSIVSLDGSDTRNLASVSILTADPERPLLLRGIDRHLISPVRVPSAFRNWLFVVSPGKHVLWVTSVPYGNPLFPQFIRCYVFDVSLDPGSRYILRYDSAQEQTLLLRQGEATPEATGLLVDKPLMLERNCRWP